MNDYQYEQLDRYFQRSMTTEEALTFRSELEADPELREAFNLRRLAAAALHRTEVSAFRERMQESQPRQIVAPEAVIRRMTPLRWAMAAAAALLLVALIWYLLPSTSKGEALYAQYDTPALFPKTEYVADEGHLHKGILGEGDFTELKKQGLTAYAAQDWDAAIRRLSEYLQKAKPTEEETPDEINLMNLYLGRAWLENGDAPKAIASLQSADAGITDEISYALFRELIRWHLALAHLKNGDLPAAIKTTELLRNAQHEGIRQQAARLLLEIG